MCSAWCLKLKRDHDLNKAQARRFPEAMLAEMPPMVPFPPVDSSPNRAP